MILANKVAIIYGAGGSIGHSVALAFAREGAKVYLTGNKKAPLITVADAITAAGGIANIDVVDATNEQELNKHFQSVLAIEKRVDISFNAMGIGQAGVQGTPLSELPLENFLRPITVYSTSHFLTARIAAAQMTKQRSGVILTLTATPSKKAAPLTGGMGPMWAAIEGLTRTLAGELGSSGVRVVCLRADGMPETDTITEVFGLHAAGLGLPSHKEFQSIMESMTLMKRLPKLSELADTAAFIASDMASGITGTAINVSCGAVLD